MSKESESAGFDLEAYERDVASHTYSESNLNALARSIHSDQDKQKLIKAALWIALKVAKENQNQFPGWSIGDVIEEANIGLFMAADDLQKRGDEVAAPFISNRIKTYLDSLK
jgi:DNA-directed RNA polymerase sigma subunit (sigma70/sigma32)